MKAKKLLVIVSIAAVLPLHAQADEQVEANAGNWRTWVISSGADYRVPPPPRPAQTQAELRFLADLMKDNDEEDRQQIAFWDAGAPSYRWMDIINTRLLAGTPTSTFPHRVQTYVALAMHDATVATWESKYYYNRPRPGERGRKVQALWVERSPSYPSEHAATAQAAATVLGYFLPEEALAFQAMAEQAGWSRVLAGVQYPSDYEAGLALGRRVAEQVIAKAQADGSDVPWTGSVPSGPCNWIATTTLFAAAANWKPLLLDAASQYRSAPPPACDSPQVIAETAIVRNFPRSATSNAAFITNHKAFYWQSPDGLHNWPYRYANQWMFEDRLDRNAPRTARAYALIAAAYFDAFIASQDSKYTYWYLRPNELDDTIKPLFPVPPFPSYPSNHSAFSAVRAEVLAYLFPTRADVARAFGKEAGDSRIWAGLHYPMDNVAGVELGKAIAARFISWAQSDGSQ